MELEKTLGGDTKGLNEKLENLLEEKKSQKSKISDYENQRKECDIEIKKSTAEITALKEDIKKKREKSDDMRTKLQAKFSSLEETVKKFSNSYADFDLDALESQLNQNKEKYEKLSTQKSQKEKEIINLGQKRSSFDIRESHLKDALELVKKQQEMDKEKIIFKEIKEEMKNMMDGKDGEEAQLEKIKRKIRKVQDQIDTKNEKLQFTKGELNAQQEEMGKLRLALAEPNMLSANEKYKNAIIKESF